MLRCLYMSWCNLTWIPGEAVGPGKVIISESNAEECQGSLHAYLLVAIYVNRTRISNTLHQFMTALIERVLEPY